VTVRRGDSLWLIAAHRLGPNISDERTAAEWPRWYAVNRAAIGDNADLLMPGQHLSAPAAVNSSPKD
jgi:nucleoid-associated protein YgaU